MTPPLPFGSERGQGLVEFAITLPIFLALLAGLINASWMFFQQQSVMNAARAGARQAALLAPVFENGTSTACSSGYGEPSPTQASPALQIEAAAARSAMNVPVNASALCAGGPAATTMSSSITDPNKANIIVTASPNLAAPTKVTVTVSFTSHPLLPFWPVSSDTMTSSSTETTQATQ